MKGLKTMLSFEVSATDSISFPAENVYMIEATGANAGAIYFHPGGITAGDAKNGKIVFNSSTNNLYKCIQELSKVIALSDPGLVEVANTTNNFTHKACPSLVLTNLAISITL